MSGEGHDISVSESSTQGHAGSCGDVMLMHVRVASVYVLEPGLVTRCVNILCYRRKAWPASYMLEASASDLNYA